MLFIIPLNIMLDGWVTVYTHILSVIQLITVNH